VRAERPRKERVKTMKTDLPTRPDLPFRPELAKPKSHKVLWVILGAVGMFIVLAIIGLTLEPEADVAPITAPDAITEQVADEPTTDFDVNLEAARIGWNGISAADRTAICDYYNTPPVGTTPEMVRLFADGTEMSYAEADRVLDIVLAEEC
jgi:hypothetical protein